MRKDAIACTVAGAESKRAIPGDERALKHGAMNAAPASAEYNQGSGACSRSTAHPIRRREATRCRILLAWASSIAGFFDGTSMRIGTILAETG